MLSYLSSLPISVLRSLDTEANKFCDRSSSLYDAALLTRCYSQHALRPVIASKINHLKHFNTIPFINKGINFIDLSAVLNHFKNCEVPITCYKYNKPISIKLFLTFISKLVLLTHENIKTLNKFIRLWVKLLQAMKNISDSRIRSMIANGPKYGFPAKIDFQKCRQKTLHLLINIVIVGVSESMWSVMLKSIGY